MNKRLLRCTSLLPVVLLATGAVKAQSFWPMSAPNEAMFEFVGQVKNSPPAGAGLPATSVQYGYLSHIQGLTDDEIFLPGIPKSEATALFTFYNDSVNDTVTDHGSLRVVIREGTTTIYYNPVAGGDLTTPKPESFRQGTPVLSSKWRHQVIFDVNAGSDPAAPPRTNLFFVTWWHNVTSAQIVELGDKTVLLGFPGVKFEQHLVGGVDLTGKVNGKFAGYAESLAPVIVRKRY